MDEEIQMETKKKKNLQGPDLVTGALTKSKSQFGALHNGAKINAPRSCSETWRRKQHQERSGEGKKWSW